MNLSPNSFEHESQELPISQLKPDPNNPRKRDKRSLSEIAKSIKEFGFVQPIVTDEEYNIIIGHGRYAAAFSRYSGFLPKLINRETPQTAVIK
jgi:ParB/RepB/Spo0J family partition protein